MCEKESNCCCERLRTIGLGCDIAKTTTACANKWYCLGGNELVVESGNTVPLNRLYGNPEICKDKILLKSKNAYLINYSFEILSITDDDFVRFKVMTNNKYNSIYSRITVKNCCGIHSSAANSFILAPKEDIWLSFQVKSKNDNCIKNIKYTITINSSMNV
ncbi:MAG: hypothetical protein RR246_03100 [Clostridia bacterium]